MTTREPDHIFSSTHWSVVLAAGEESDPARAHAALTQICQTYWLPLYSFVRGRGYPMHDAQDLTQSFFAYLIKKKIYARVSPRKGKFRSFLLASFKNFLADQHDRAQSIRRGGGRELLPLDEERVAQAEALYQTRPHGSGEDQLFQRAWAERLVQKSLEQLAAQYRREGQEPVFARLRIFLTGSAEPLPTYDELAARLGVQASTLRGQVTRLRARYREALRAEVGCTVKNEAEVDEELRELLRVLAST